MITVKTETMRLKWRNEGSKECDQRLTVDDLQVYNVHYVQHS